MLIALLLVLLAPDGFDVRPGFSVRQAKAPSTAAKPAEKKAPADPAASAVGVWCPTGFGGSGTCVACDGGKSLVVTNRHVVEGTPLGARVAVTTADGTRHGGTLLATDRRADLALVLVDAVLPAAELAAAPPPAGTPVRQWGRDWRGQGRPVFKAGVFLGIGRGTVGGVTITETTIDSISGDSGCGVFDEHGRLVAVNWGGGSGSPQCAVGLADVVSFLRNEARLHFPRLAAELDDRRAAKAEAVEQARQAKGAKPVTWLTDYDAAIKDSAGKTVVVLFTDPVGCVPCKRLESGALADPAVRDELAKCVCVKADVRTAAGQALIARFNAHGDVVSAWPTLKVYKAGVRVADHVGDAPAETILKLLR